MATIQKAYRLPTDLLERIDRYRERLGENLPAGVTITEAAVVKSLLEKGLDAVEAGEDGKKRKKQ